MKTITKTKRNLVLVLICVLLVALAISPVSANQNTSGVVSLDSGSAGEYSNIAVADNYTSVASSENLELFADMSTGRFAVKNLNSGYVWYSTASDLERDSITLGKEKDYAQSILVVEYVNVDNEIETALTEYCDSNNAVATEVSNIDNGIRVDITFEVDLSSNAGDDESSAEEVEESIEAELVNLTVPVEFILDGDVFRAKVDIKNVKCDEHLIITGYDLLPYFGAADWTEDGYIFVPDGSGALINFNGHEETKSSYDEMVYGDDLSIQSDLNSTVKEAIRMPVFGLNNGSNAIFGIITEGAASSRIKANPTNYGHGYSKVNAEFKTKLLSTIVMFGKTSNKQEVNRLSEGNGNVDTFTVDYYFLSGNDADYVGMAKTYRSYLEEKGDLSKKTTKPVLNVDTYGAIDVTANFLGFSYKKLESLTSYSEVSKIADDLQSSGINNLGVRYIGWGNNGLTNDKILSSASYLGVLGGKKDFQTLSEYLEEKSISLTLDSDLITFTDGKSKYASKTAFAETYYKYQYLRSVYVRDLNGNEQMMLIPNMISKFSSKYFDSYTKKVDCDSISLSTLTNSVYSSLRPNKTVYRTMMPGYVEEVLENANSRKLNVSGESANDFTFKYLSKIYHAPLYSSAYTIFDSEVPFYQIVLHGYITMTGEPMVQSLDSLTTFLKCVESGSELLWNGIYEDAVQLNDTNYDDLYGSTYTLWIDDATEKYTAYQPLLEKIYDKTIVAHSEISKNVSLTEYDNGVKVYVNFTNKDVVVDGVKVTAKNFAYKEG